VQPDVLAKHLTENNQIPAVVSEVLRSKALNLVVEHVKATDDKGAEVDIAAMLRHEAGEDEEHAETTATAEAETAEAAETSETGEAADDKADA
jgi:trigger factor